MPDIRQSPEWEFYERHFATSRMQPYLVEHRGDKRLAIDLYAWNMDVSAAFWELLGYLEIALRNRIDERMTASTGSEKSHWIFHFEDQSLRRNQMMTKELGKARERILRNSKTPTSQRMISELPFGFWVTLLSKRYRNLWPNLAAGFPGMPSRNPNDLFCKAASMRDLRNRIGHHHRIWTLELREKHDELLSIAGYIDAEFGEWLTSTSRVPGLLRTRPSRER
jgi:hypothetical protein